MVFKKVGVMLLLATMVLVSSCSKKEQINFYNWTYYVPDEILERFEQETNVKVMLETYDGNETMYAKLATGNHNFDIAVPSSDFVSIMKNKGMLQPINKDLIPNFSNIDETVLSYIKFDEGNEYSVPYFLGTTGISVNTKEMPEYPESWSMFSNKDSKYRGRMSVMSDMRDILGGALRYLGYSGNTVKPEEIDEARDLIINEWKPNIIFDAESFGKSFANGSLIAAQGFPEVVLKELENGPATEGYKFFLPKEGTMMYFDNFVILKESKNVSNAHNFINFMLQPDIHAFIADYFYYPTIIKGAEKLRKNSAPYDINDALNAGEFRNDLGTDLELYTAAWSKIMEGN